MSDVVDKAEAWDAATAIPPKAQKRIQDLEAQVATLTIKNAALRQIEALLLSLLEDLGAGQPDVAEPNKH